MRRILVAIVLLSPLTWAPAAAQERQGPGYGVVESVTRIARPPAEPSASAGASSPSEPRRAGRTGYLVRMRMDDGSVQVRSVKRPEVKVGQRALVTNAGDIVPE